MILEALALDDSLADFVASNAFDLKDDGFDADSDMALSLSILNASLETIDYQGDNDPVAEPEPIREGDNLPGFGPLPQRESKDPPATIDHRNNYIGPNDILLGRGRVRYNHPGNIRLRNLVNDYFDNFHASNKNEKTVLAMTIVDNILTNGGRFLIKEEQDQSWSEISRLEARAKVSVSFRSERKKREAMARRRNAQLRGAASE